MGAPNPKFCAKPAPLEPELTQVRSLQGGAKSRPDGCWRSSSGAERLKASRSCRSGGRGTNFLVVDTKPPFEKDCERKVQTSESLSEMMVIRLMRRRLARQLEPYQTASSTPTRRSLDGSQLFIGRSMLPDSLLNSFLIPSFDPFIYRSFGEVACISQFRLQVGGDYLECVDFLVLTKFFVAFILANRMVSSNLFIDLLDQIDEFVELLKELAVQLQSIGVLQL
jgi:hypothetical protein